MNWLDICALDEINPLGSRVVAGPKGDIAIFRAADDQVFALEPYWEAVRRLYAPFESGLDSPTGRVYRHEIPGGQLSNLRQQALALGLADRFEDIESAYAGADRAWKNAWKDAERLPAMIRLTVRDAASQRVLSVSTIAPVHVQIPSDCTKPDGNCGEIGRAHV